MDDQEFNRRKQRSETIWTLIIIAAFITAWPLGLVLAILKGKHILPELAMGTPSSAQRGQSYTAPKYRAYTGTNPPGHTDQAGQPGGQSQTDRARQQADYWARQAQEQAERSRQRAMQWAVPVTDQARQAARQAQEQARQAARQAQEQARQAVRQARAQAAPYRQQPGRPPVAKENLKLRKLRFGKPMFITGLCLSGVGFLSLAAQLTTISGLRDLLVYGFIPAGILAVGAYLAGLGFLRAKQSKRLQEYAAILPANDTYYSIDELADRTGRPYAQVLADLQRMVELGVWDQAWIDRRHRRLMFTQYSAEQMTREEPPKKEKTEDGRAEQVLQRIRADNDRIGDEVMSRKIDRIELLTGEIFRYLSKHPEREGELRSFMDYYLPQTLKILETYAQLEEQGVETDNIRKAKDQISDMLDQLTESYERQLDKLFDTDVLDISADIEVMRQMLRSDGLSADELEMQLEKTE